MGGTHKTAYAEHQPEADEPEQDGAEHEVYQIFISTLAVFLVRMNPASTSANPGCMKNTSMAASSIHTVLSPVASSPRAPAVASGAAVVAATPASCAQRPAGSINKSIVSIIFLVYVVVLFYSRLYFCR